MSVKVSVADEERWTVAREETAICRAVRYYLDGVEKKTGCCPKWRLGALPWDLIPDGTLSTILWHGAGENSRPYVRLVSATGALLAVYAILPHNDSLKRLPLAWPPRPRRYGMGGLVAGAARRIHDIDEVPREKWRERLTPEELRDGHRIAGIYAEERDRKKGRE